MRHICHSQNTFMWHIAHVRSRAMRFLTLTENSMISDLSLAPILTKLKTWSPRQSRYCPKVFKRSPRPRFCIVTCQTCSENKKQIQWLITIFITVFKIKCPTSPTIFVYSINNVTIHCSHCIIKKWHSDTSNYTSQLILVICLPQFNSIIHKYSPYIS